MNLRATFPAPQLLSASIAAMLVGSSLLTPIFTPAANAQTPAAAGADRVELKTNPPQIKANVLVTRVVGGKVFIREGAGEIGYDVAQIKEVVKAAPNDFAQGQRLVEAGDFTKAIPFIKAVAENFRGLPVAWAQDASAMLGNLYLSTNSLSEAEAAIGAHEKAYPGAGSTAATLGKARLAAARRNYAEARGIADPIVAGALQKKNVSRAESQLFGQAYFVLGQCAEGENKLPEAMENYCRVVAIFYQEPSIVAEAQKRIDGLRQKGVTTP